MQSKSLFIAMAAFAVTATGVHAYTGPKVLANAGLSGEQISAFATARELREAGNIVAARNVLVEAGIDDEILLKIQRATRANRQAIQGAIDNQDYEGFKEVIVGTPLARNTPTLADFNRLVEFSESGGDLSERHGRAGHRGKFAELSDEQREALSVARQANDRPAMNAILDEAGIK
jgi:hypothetical protein